MQVIEKTGLAVLSKENYFKVLKKIQVKNSIDFIEFMQKIPLLN